jgi:tRNA(Phe) wybutosine-synthesizing methylase Tyw3
MRKRKLFFTLVKEARDYVRIRLEDSDKKVCINVPKNLIFDFDKRSRYAFFDENYICFVYEKEMRKIHEKEIRLKAIYQRQLEQEKINTWKKYEMETRKVKNELE